MMPKYLVTMPVTGFVSREVEADGESGAIRAFWDLDADPLGPDAWQFTEHVVVSGGVSTALQNDVQVRRVSVAEAGGADAPISIRVGPWDGARSSGAPRKDKLPEPAGS